MLESIINILVRRDGMSPSDARDLLNEAREAVADGMDPEEACAEFFGLEPDYIWELI